MPSNAVKELMEQVTDLRIAVGELKVDLSNIKKLVYIGVGTNSVAVVIAAVIMHVWGK